jgi:hypothetical protein
MNGTRIMLFNSGGGWNEFNFVSMPHSIFMTKGPLRVQCVAPVVISQQAGIHQHIYETVGLHTTLIQSCKHKHSHRLYFFHSF